MYVKAQFAGTLSPRSATTWASYGWDPAAAVVWTVVPTGPVVGGPQLKWSQTAQKSAAGTLNYYITVQNLTAQEVSAEVRLAVLN